MTLVWLAMGLIAPPVPAQGAAQVVAEVENGAARVRILRSGSELVEELSAKDVAGVYRSILVSPTYPGMGNLNVAATNSLIKGTDGRLFTAPPTFHFSQAAKTGRSIVLTSKIGEWSVKKTIELPAKGTQVAVSLSADTSEVYPQIRYLLNGYAFMPGTPDETWTPGLRPKDNDVIGDHWFRSPVVLLRKGSLAATIMPDVDVLSQNRPIPTILDLDVANGVVKAPLVSYGFCNHKVSGHVRYSSDDSMAGPVPGHLQLRTEIKLDAHASPGSAVNDVSDYMWQRYGHRYFDAMLPQVMPFADYAELCYPAAFKEKQTGGWFEMTINGQECGGLPSGWGLTDGQVSWQCWFMQLRSAWGLHWWGGKLNHPDWVEKSNKMLNLALAAPRKKGACCTTYNSKKNEWDGGLVNPTSDSYYDIPSIAWKGIWYMRWLTFKDCPRRAEVEEQVEEIRQLLTRIQNKDGSFPSWLTKDLKVVPMLDRSAQSALPLWFLGEYTALKTKPLEPRWRELKAHLDLAGRNGITTESIRNELQVLRNEINALGPKLPMAEMDRGAKFVSEQVIPKALYYDFETFFSCSPKVCLQKGGKLDDPRMWDAHTLQPPQNTLSMQWVAEALRVCQNYRTRVAYIEKTLATKASAPKVDSSADDPKELALNTMNLYQNVWPISYRPVAYTYGGFGVQNSDGEYDDARQSQFGATLCDFGAQMDRQDLFERGVAAIRASLALVNVPNDPYQVYPNPNYPIGLEPENCGHGGTNEQNGRSGFDWAEGSGLTGAAEIMDRYGSIYQGKGWKVAIDGTPPASAKKMPLENPLFDFTKQTLSGWDIDATYLNWPTRSNRRDFGARGKPFIGTCENGRGGFDDAYTGTMTSPAFTCSGEIHLLVGGGSGEGVGVELIDADGKRIAVAHGNDDEMMHPVTWRVDQRRPTALRVRIFDREKGPWGHINVGGLAVGN